jgi:DNA-directed RNA polymerase subunit beta'
MASGSFLSNKLLETAKSDFDFIKIGLASPEKIRSWSYGEVKKAETYNYRTNKPEKDGLLCSVIFGTQKAYECLCGKYRKYKYRGIICEKCGVEVTDSGVRRERMGHIELAFPVVHTWFFYSSPSCIAILLEIPLKTLEKVAYFESYIVVEQGTTTLQKGKLLSSEELEEALNEFGEDSFKAMIGAAAIKELLAGIDLELEKKILTTELAEVKSITRKTSIVRRIELIDNFIKSGNKPEWMVIDILPVLPPDLRPCLMLDTGKFVSSDLNDLYRRVLNRNNRLKNLVALGAPEVIIRNEQRMLQEAVDALFDNERKSKVAHSNGRLYKSLSEVLSGKQGRFRQNLLGKRVDYSGRSVIVVGPKLKLHQCGLPRRMALELFKPFIYSKLIMYGKAASIKVAKAMVDAKTPEVLEILEEVTQCYPVLLNRAPTLHRLGIQAFEPILSNHNAIELHPLVCTAFNADFDGDQMAVHVPLSIEAQTEARVLMLASNNIISLSSGEPIITPTQDIVLGTYSATYMAVDAPTKDKLYTDLKEIDYDLSIDKTIKINSKIKFCNIVRDKDGIITELKTYETTPGRVKLYKLLPENQIKIPFEYINKGFTKKDIHILIDKVYDNFESEIVAGFADDLMRFGFEHATKTGVSIGKDDILVPASKPARIKETLEKTNEYEEQFKEGYITVREKYNKITDAWQECANQVTEDMVANFKKKSDTTDINSIYMIAHSGARGSITQIKQLAGMRGLIVKTSGEILETPIISNFKEGLTISEYFNSAHGARKGLADTALKTADAGYLTRRLVDVSQNCVVTEYDCQINEGIIFVSRFEKNKLVKHVSKIAHGRIPVRDIKLENGDVLVKSGEIISRGMVELLEKHNIHEIEVRSIVKCKTQIGVCAKCYGADIVTRKLVEIGQPIGIIAAQSIGEPGTQLTMRTFQVGGVAFRSVDKPFVNAEDAGVISFINLNFVKNKKGEKLVVSNNAGITLSTDKEKVHKYIIPYGSKLLISDGDVVKKDQKLADIEIHTTPIISEYKGKISLFDLINGVSYKEEENESTGIIDKTVIESNLHPGVRLLDEKGDIIQNVSGNLLTYYFPVGATVLVSENDQIEIGDVVARLPKTAQKSRDITGGLPRVVDLFEARKPKNPEIISPCDGYVSDIKSYKTKKKIIITPSDGSEVHEFSVGNESYIVVNSGSKIYKGDTIVSGEKNPYDILKIGGIDKLVEYILSEIQAVYELQGVKINDKHIEIIVKYMLRKVKVISGGDTSLIEGQVIQLAEYEILKEDMISKGKIAPVVEPILQGITRASLETESFISAASFQETAKVLTFAAISGKRDRLIGIKENVVVGKLIPAGTGLTLDRISKMVEGYKASKEE